jgi:hypothetical protein
MSTKEVKINENKPNFNEKYSSKFNKDNNNFNERINNDYNNTLNQQQDAINMTLHNTLHNVNKITDKARQEVPQYWRRIAEYQEKTIQTIKDIAYDVIKSQNQVIDSFQSQQQVNGNSSNDINFSNGLWWDLYNPQRIAENNAAMVNNFTSYLLNASNIINNALASNMRIYNTALEQTRDNVKAFTKTNTIHKISNSRNNNQLIDTMQK